MPQKQYTVQAPDGRTITLEGPDGASQDEVIAQAQRLMGEAPAQPKMEGVQSGGSSTAGPPGPGIMDMRVPGMPSPRDVVQAGKGLIGLPKDLSQMQMPSGGEMLKTLIPGYNAMNTLGGAAQSIAAAPGNAVSGDPYRIGQAGNAAMLLAGIGKAGVGAVKGAVKGGATTPMELYGKAAANRQAASTPAAATGQLLRGVANTNIPDTASAAIKLAASPVRKGVAYLQEKMADSLMDSELARLKERPREPIANAPNTTKAPRQATATPYTGNAMEGRVVERPPEPPAKPDIREIERGIAPSGERAKRSTLRTAPKLAVEVPELAGLRPGPEFDKALVDGFKRTEMKIDLADNNVPPSTQVPRTPIIDEFKAIEADYKSRGLEAMESKVAKIREKWEALPEAIPWGTFVKMKRAFFKEGSITSAPMRRSYRAVMDASSKVSTELSDANYSYSVVRQALDDAKIDPTTGRRIMEVGKK